MNETKYGKQKRKQKNPQKTPNPRSKGKTVPKATSTDRTSSTNVTTDSSGQNLTSDGNVSRSPNIPNIPEPLNNSQYSLHTAYEAGNEVGGDQASRYGSVNGAEGQNGGFADLRIQGIDQSTASLASQRQDVNQNSVYYFNYNHGPVQTASDQTGNSQGTGQTTTNETATTLAEAKSNPNMVKDEEGSSIEEVTEERKPPTPVQRLLNKVESGVGAIYSRLIPFHPGKEIRSNKHRYMIEKRLGAGGYGAVYKVFDMEKPENCYAMKVAVQKGMKYLKMEVNILKTIRHRTKDENSHFVNLIDRGKQKKFCFIVMSLLKMSLDKLKKTLGKLTLPTVLLTCGLQGAEAIWALQRFGYLHRDVKPANFVMGQGKNARRLYIVDFGLCRRIKTNDNFLRPPRTKIHCRGTARFMSMRAHVEEQCPADDFISWFYSIIDLVLPGGLPWKYCGSFDDVCVAKEKHYKKKGRDLVKDIDQPEILAGIYNYLESLEYADSVDYTFIRNSLLLVAKNIEVNENTIFDWE